MLASGRLSGLLQCDKPLVLVTTSHRPTQRVRSFVKDLVSVLPCAIRFTRGKAGLRDLYYEARVLGVKRVIVVSTWKGNPGTLNVYEPMDIVESAEHGLRLLARIRLRGVRLSRETPGAKRGSGASALGVYVASSDERLHLFGDTLVRCLLGRLVFDPETPGFDVVAIVGPGGSGYFAEVRFTCRGGSENRICGPIMRIAGVDDFVSGFRLHRAGGVEAEASGGVEGSARVGGSAPS